MHEYKLSRIEDALEDFKQGKFVIVVDDEDRENEGDLITAAETITAEKVNFMLKNARGVLCAPITIQRAEELDLPHQVSDNTSKAAPRACRHTTAPRRYAPSPTQHRHRRPLAARDTSIHYMPRTTACCDARDTPRLR